MQCPECKANNRPNASFCIECGEPLELNNAPELVRARPLQPAMEAAIPYRGPFGSSPDQLGEDKIPFPASMISWIPRPFNPLGWGLEVRITVLVLLVAIGYDLLSQSAAQSDASNYQRGLQAEQQKHWHDAANLLKPLALNNYQEAASHYKKVEQQVTEFDSYDNLAQGVKLDGSLLRTALYFKQANQIEPGYDGVDKALTETLANAGQILYQKPDGLYLADATGVPLSALPGSDAQTEVLAVSADDKYVAYTGFDVRLAVTGSKNIPAFSPQFVPPNNQGVYYMGTDNFQQATTRKVYIRNLITGATESFDDVPIGGSGTGLAQPFARFATFVNNDKGLLFETYRNDDNLPSVVADLSYFDIAANAGLHKIDTIYPLSFAQPTASDTHLYYVPVDRSKPGVQNSIVSYDLNTNRGNLIAHSDGTIDEVALGGKLIDDLSFYTLFYVASENNRLRIYSKQPPDASTSTLLVDVADDSANTDAKKTDIAPAPEGDQAIVIKLGMQQEGWLLKPSGGSKAISLRDIGWGLLMNNPLYMQYSPDGSQVLVQGTDVQGDAKTWFTLVDSSLQLNLRPSWLPNIAYLQWMSDGKHLYTISDKGFSIIDATSGQQLVYVARKTPPSSDQGQLTLLPDNQTLLYAADDGVYISDVTGQYPIRVLTGATAAWLISATK